MDEDFNIYQTEKYKELIKKYHIDVGKLIQEILLKNLSKKEMEKELENVKQKVKRAKEAQDKYIKEMQARCPHLETIETTQNKVKYVFCKECLKRLK